MLLALYDLIREAGTGWRTRKCKPETLSGNADQNAERGGHPIIETIETSCYTFTDPDKTITYNIQTVTSLDYTLLHTLVRRSRCR